MSAYILFMSMSDQINFIADINLKFKYRIYVIFVINFKCYEIIFSGLVRYYGVALMILVK